MSNKRILALKAKIAGEFKEANWLELSLLCDGGEIIKNHGRLLRSLHWGDEDYEGCVLEVLMALVGFKTSNLDIIEQYVDQVYGNSNEKYISHAPSDVKITFAPKVFRIPTEDQDPRMASVMMPFAPKFDPVYTAIQKGCLGSGFTCKRADEIWGESEIINDIFRIIYLAKVVIVDFSEKNPNVMYETGIAHTLGKLVMPICQNTTDIPFDLRHHRAVIYQPTEQGLKDLASTIDRRLSAIKIEDLL